MWCPPGLAGWQVPRHCPCSREPPASPAALCRASLWSRSKKPPPLAEELSEGPWVCAAWLCLNQGKHPFTPQRPLSPDSVTRAPAAISFCTMVTTGEPTSHPFHQVDLPCENGSGELGHAVSMLDRSGGSTLQCCSQETIWGAKSKQVIFQAEQRPIWITEIAFLLSQHSNPSCSHPTAGIKAQTQTSHYVCVYMQESWTTGNIPTSTQNP